jgi:pimeloyl-ACP methyl ester carboxylesterase
MRTNRIASIVLLLVAAVAVTFGACMSTPKMRLGHLRASDGVEIVYDVRGEGEPAIVLVHCWCGNRTFWKNQIADLARDHRVVTLDLPGHGESGHDRKTWNVASLGADVARVVQELDLKRVILVGHSMGGPVALCAAARLPGRVAGIVAVDTLHDADHGMTREQVEQFAASFERDFAAGMKLAVASMLPKDVDPAVAQWIVSEGLRTDHAAAIALMRDFPNVDTPALFRRAGAPIRAINSAGSPWPTNVAANKKYADFDAVIMQGVGHYPHLEKPAEFNPLLRKTIAELEKR